jgi:H/ACA ribonucleoprotein complex subunit 2
MAAEKPDKKEKKDKKRSDESGVGKVKKEKKDKKDKKEKLAAALDAQKQQEAATKTSPAVTKDDSDSDMEEDKAEELPLERTVVSFAIPVADEKGMKKVYKTIRKCTFHAPNCKSDRLVPFYQTEN